MLNLTATNVGRVTINPERAKLDCDAALKVKTDGRVTVSLAGCGRTVTFEKSGSSACGSTALSAAKVRPRGRRLRVTLPRRRTTVDVLRNSRGRTVLGNRRVARLVKRRSFTWTTRARRASTRCGCAAAVTRGASWSVRRGGRFHRRGAFARRPGCGTLRTFALGLPVFGGTRGRPLAVAYRLGAKRTARITVLRGKRVVRR